MPIGSGLSLSPIHCLLDSSGKLVQAGAPQFKDVVTQQIKSKGSTSLDYVMHTRLFQTVVPHGLKAVRNSFQTRYDVPWSKNAP